MIIPNINTRKFILGKPVELPFGRLRFLTVEEYMDMEVELQLISMNTLHIYYAQKKLLANKLKRKEMIEFEKTKELPLYQLVLYNDYFLHTYLSIFDKLIEFNEGFNLNHLFESEEVFMEVRSIIMMMNFLREEKVYKNEELQKNHEEGNKVRVNSSNNITLEDIITAVVASTSNTYEDIDNMTVYQLNALYLRITAIKDYETSTLFATVSSEAKIEHWTKHIDLFESKDNSSIKLSEFKNKLSEAF